MDNLEPKASIEEKQARRMVLSSAVMVNLLGNLGITGTNIVLPAMGRELSLSAVLMGWVSLSLLMVMAACAAPGAKLSDILGRRYMASLGLLLCIAGLIMSAMANGAITLILSRVINGIGFSLVFTNTTAMATSVYPGKMRGRVLGYTVASVYIGLSIGPIICGYMANIFGWRAVYWLSAFGMLPPLVLLRLVKIEQAPAKGERLNPLGTALWMLTVLLLFFGLTRINQFPLGIILSLAGLLAAVFFVRFSLNSSTPVLDIRLFSKSRRFSFSSLAAFISYSASTGTAFIVTLYLQYIKGLSPSHTGLIMMVQPACQAIITPFAGRLSDKLDAGVMASTGMAVLSFALWLLSLNLSAETPLSYFIAILILMGVGFAIFSAPNSNAIIGSAPPDKIGHASGVITATRLCGQVFSIAVTTMVFAYVIGPQQILPPQYPALLKASIICFSIFAPTCAIGVVASLARGKK